MGTKKQAIDKYFAVENEPKKQVENKEPIKKIRKSVINENHKKDYTRRTFSLRADLYKKLNKLAFDKDISKTAYIENWLETL